MHPPFKRAENLAMPELAPHLSHGFFSRRGGVSTGIYKSLNVGAGSDDAPDDVAENRARCAAALGAVDANHLLTLNQIHSADVIVVDAPFASAPPKADALVTNRPGLAIGILTADCMPFLFADPQAGVIGAAHAGWRGALAGVIEATVEKMETLGADRSRIKAALGPCLRQDNFEVGLDLVEAFEAKHDGMARFFAPGVTDDKRQFDLAGFAAAQLQMLGIEDFFDLGVCTLARAEDYFSYRASRRRGEPDYGRNLSAIMLNA